MNASGATTPKVETLIEKGEFLNSAQFSPDGKSILVSASPEAFNGIGKNVEEGQTPSMIDTQLYLMTLSDKKVRLVFENFLHAVAVKTPIDLGARREHCRTFGAVQHTCLNGRKIGGLAHLPGPADHARPAATPRLCQTFAESREFRFVDQWVISTGSRPARACGLKH